VEILLSDRNYGKINVTKIFLNIWKQTKYLTIRGKLMNTCKKSVSALVVRVALLVVVVLVGVFAIFQLTSCAYNDNVVVNSLGKYDNVNYSSNTVNGIKIVYGRYTFADPALEGNEYFAKVTESDVATLTSYGDHYANMVKSMEISDYDFTSSLIDTADYFYVTNSTISSNGNYKTYDFYLYNTQTNVVYYLSYKA
jgi:hypothetical protein